MTAISLGSTYMYVGTAVGLYVSYYCPE